MFRNKKSEDPDLMQLRSKVDNLAEELSEVKSKTSNYKSGLDEFYEKLNSNLATFETSINNKVVSTLLEFQKEIYDKLFSSVKSLFRYAKEIQLIDTLAHNVKDEDIAKVKSALLKPILEERWKSQDIEKTNNINKNILKIVEQRNVLLQEKLKLERENRDSKFISGQLDMLDKIIKESKNEESTV